MWFPERVKRSSRRRVNGRPFIVYRFAMVNSRPPRKSRVGVRPPALHCKSRGFAVACRRRCGRIRRSHPRFDFGSRRVTVDPQDRAQAPGTLAGETFAHLLTAAEIWATGFSPLACWWAEPSTTTGSEEPCRRRTTRHPMIWRTHRWALRGLELVSEPRNFTHDRLCRAVRAIPRDYHSALLG